MPFIVPTFPLIARIWTHGQFPGGEPRLDTPCQLRAPNPNTPNSVGGLVAGSLGIIALFPPGTDIRDGYSGVTNSSDTIEIPVDSGRYYTVGYVNDIALGFPNVHRYAVLAKTTNLPWPEPLP
jgi:hypothetical protein